MTYKCKLAELRSVTSTPDPRAEAKTDSEANAAASFIVLCLTVDVIQVVFLATSQHLN